MGAVVSQLGFNQAFLLALIGILLMLGLTVVAVSENPRDTYSHYDYSMPQIRVRAAATPPRKTV